MSKQRRTRGFRPLGRDELGRLTFHGAAGEVTGSCYLLELEGGRVLVECGLFQGGRAETARNRRPFPFDPRGIDAVVLTHAHIDHSGLLPKLVRDGFSGPVHATGATRDLLRILLPDSAHIHELEAAQASRRRLRRGSRPVDALYTAGDAEDALALVETHGFGQRFEVLPGLEVAFRRAGHILGAASAELWIRSGSGARKLVFSGDVGRRHEPILRDPDPPGEADVLVLESTYGDRDHRDQEESLSEFAEILERAAAEGGNVIVPVFAVGRAQEILYFLGRFEREGRVRPRPVFLDSPMAIHATELYLRHTDSFGPTIRRALERGEVEPDQLAFCRTPDESRALNEKRGIVILTASGMCDAGRVVHHLKHHLWRRESHVVFAGFQAQGTRGRALVEGARKVRIFGEEIAVRANIHTVGGFSAHGGQSELVHWASSMLASGAHVVLVHGEPEKRSAFAEHIAPRTPHAVRSPEAGDRLVVRARGEPVAFESGGRALAPRR